MYNKGAEMSSHWRKDDYPLPSNNLCNCRYLQLESIALITVIIIPANLVELNGREQRVIIIRRRCNNIIYNLIRNDCKFNIYDTFIYDLMASSAYLLYKQILG